MLLQYPRAVHGIDSPELLVPDGDVEELVRVFRLHECHRLLELGKVPFENLGVLKAVDELGKVFDIVCQGRHAIPIDLLDVWREREGLCVC